MGRRLPALDDGDPVASLRERFEAHASVDVAGEVVESDDARFAAGDAVLVTGYGLSQEHDGGYSEFVRVPGDWVVPMPEGVIAFVQDYVARHHVEEPFHKRKRKRADSADEAFARPPSWTPGRRGGEADG